MAVLTSYTTGQDNSNTCGWFFTARRTAQSFQIDSLSNCTGAELYLNDGGGGQLQQQLTVMIQTDSSGKPSGTLVDANATATIEAASVTDTFAFIPVEFTPFPLSGATTYWLVCKTTSETDPGGNNYGLWGNDATSPTYPSGNAATSTNAGSTWTDQATQDQLFIINGTVDGGNTSIGVFQRMSLSEGL